MPDTEELSDKDEGDTSGFEDENAAPAAARGETLRERQHELVDLTDPPNAAPAKGKSPADFLSKDADPSMLETLSRDTDNGGWPEPARSRDLRRDGTMRPPAGDAELERVIERDKK